MPGSTGVFAVLADAIGAPRAEQVLTRFDRYSNQPNAIKGAVRLPSDPALERAALRVFEDPGLRAVAGLDASSLAEALDARTLWALLALAARADVTVLDRLPAETALRGAPKIATIRRAAAKHAAALGSVPAAPASAEAPDVPLATARSDVPALPEKVAQVASWLAARPGADPGGSRHARGSGRPSGRWPSGRWEASGPPRRSTCSPGTRATATPTSSSRSCTARGEVRPAGVRRDDVPPRGAVLQLGACPSVEGIGAVQGLTGLRMVLTERADLAPLAECTDLQRLDVNVTGGPGSPDLTGVEALSQLPALTELHLLGTTRGADLTALRHTAVERLSLSLDGADGAFLTHVPHLRSLKLSGGSGPEDAGYDDEDGLAPLPAHPGLVDVVLRLVADGVRWSSLTTSVPGCRA